MKKKRFSDERKVLIIRESHAEGVAQTARKYGVSEQTLYTWRKRFGGMEPNQVGELRRMQQENARLKKLLAERDLEIEVMKEITAKKW
jgi:putative transposase